MRRGDIYVTAARDAYKGKPRPVVVVQDDRFDSSASVAVCPFTTRALNAPLMRPGVERSEVNGLSQESQIMIDKISSIPRDGLRDRLGHLKSADLVRLNRALIVFLGLAG